jgi:hypothetical protein
MERMGILEEEPYRRGHRRYMLQRAAAPLAATLGPDAYDRLIKALSLIYGIESYVVLRDIWGASYREVESIARWMLEALIQSAVRGAPGGAASSPRPLAEGERGRRARKPASPSRSRR